MRIDLGPDADLVIELQTRSRPLLLAWTFGPVRETAAATPPHAGAPRAVNLPPVAPAGRFIVKDNQAADFSVTLTDAKGFPTTLDGVDDTVSWTLEPDGVATLTLADGDNPLSGTVTAVAPGDATLSVDVNLGDGRSAHGAVAVSVVPGDVAQVAVVLGDPRDV